MFKKYSMELAGRTLTLEFGRYAQQANGSVLVRYGDTWCWFAPLRRHSRARAWTFSR